jgi:hypothetical protein
MEDLSSGVAGLDVGKAALAVCVRHAGARRPPPGGGDPDVFDDDALAGGGAGLASVEQSVHAAVTQQAHVIDRVRARPPSRPPAPAPSPGR